MKKFHIIVFLIIITSILVSFSVVEAASISGHGGITTKLGEVGFAQAIGILIKVLLSLAGAVALIAFVYGGYLWLTSRGIGEKINSGKTVLIWATIGLVIVLTSYVLVDFVIYALVGESQPIVVVPPPPPPPLPITKPACSNGIDDDTDGLIDYPNDPGCDDADDTDEYNPPPPECSDGIDNDGDTFTDYPNDPECTSVNDKTEAPEPPPILSPTCKWLEPVWPYDCEASGWQCIKCPSTPDANGTSPACASEIGRDIMPRMYGFSSPYKIGQRMCHICAGEYVGCEKGETCCGVRCWPDTTLSTYLGKTFTPADAMAREGKIVNCTCSDPSASNYCWLPDICNHDPSKCDANGDPYKIPQP